MLVWALEKSDYKVVKKEMISFRRFHTSRRYFAWGGYNYMKALLFLESDFDFGFSGISV